jgi:hypothetical protein
MKIGQPKLFETPERKSQRGGMFVTIDVDPGVSLRARVRI